MKSDLDGTQKTGCFSEFHSGKTFIHDLQMCCVPAICKIQRAEVLRRQ